MNTHGFGVGLLGAVLAVTAGCSAPSEVPAQDVERTGSTSAAARADQTDGAPTTAADGDPATEHQVKNDGDYSAIAGTWIGDLIWAPHGVDPSAGSPYHAELQLEEEPGPGSAVGRLVERGEADSEAICTWTVFAVEAAAPTYEVAARGGSPAGECDGGSMEIELDEERDVLVVDGRWPQGAWDGELARGPGS